MRLSHAAMSTRLAFSHAQKARHISVPTFSLSPTFSLLARPRLGGMASANVGESKVTRKKKKTKREGRQRREPAVYRRRRAQLGTLDGWCSSRIISNTVAGLSCERTRSALEVTRKKRPCSNESLQRAEGARMLLSHRGLLSNVEKQRDADYENVPSGRCGKEMQIYR